jgi:hypothetical protein
MPRVCGERVRTRGRDALPERAEGRPLLVLRLRTTPVRQLPKGYAMSLLRTRTPALGQFEAVIGPIIGAVTSITGLAVQARLQQLQQSKADRAARQALAAAQAQQAAAEAQAQALQQAAGIQASQAAQADASTTSTALWVGGAGLLAVLLLSRR